MGRRSAATELLAWYRDRARDLPWRRTRDPYRILVSEVMLQQTQVDRVLPFYARWLQAYPTAARLARGQLRRVHRLWKGLGYPSRAERLREACRIVVREREGVWPLDPTELERLPGIGPYTAAAVACFAGGRAVPLVDTNVARVLCRRDGLPLPPDRRELTAHAASCLHRRDPIAWNNALMELGALVCTARRPDCPACPWRGRCRVADDTERQLASANPLRVASPRERYGIGITDRRRPRRHAVVGIIHHRGRYLATCAAGVRPAPLLLTGPRPRGGDDRVVLEHLAEETLGAEILAARPLVTWHAEDGEGYLTRHCYRCRLFAPERLESAPGREIVWLEPASFLAAPFPPGLEPLLRRLRRYHH